MRKRHFVLLGLVFLAGLAYGLTEEFAACRFEGSIG